MAAPFRIERTDMRQYAPVEELAEMAEEMETTRSGGEGVKAPSPPRAARASRADANVEVKSYLDRLLKMIPGEVIALYVLGTGVIPAGDSAVVVVWSFICIFAVISVRAWGTADRSNGETTDWVMVIISTVAFIIWLYNLGGPFAVYDLYVPYIGTLVALAYTFFIPIFYKGPVPQG